MLENIECLGDNRARSAPVYEPSIQCYYNDLIEEASRLMLELPVRVHSQLSAGAASALTDRLEDGVRVSWFPVVERVVGRLVLELNA